MCISNCSEDVGYTDLSTELVESIVNEEFETVSQVTVSIGSRNATEYNSSRRSHMVRLVVVLCLVDVHNCFKCHQHQNNNVVLTNTHTINFYLRLKAVQFSLVQFRDINYVSRKSNNAGL